MRPNIDVVIAGPVDEKDIGDCETVPELNENYKKALLKGRGDRLTDFKDLQERASALLAQAQADEEAEDEIDDAKAA